MLLQEGCFKCFDFGLSYSLDETGRHLTHSAGYRAPEVVHWNRFLVESARKPKSPPNVLIYRVLVNNNWEMEEGLLEKDKEELGGRPGTQADMWAFGCLVAETILGRKLFRAGDKLSTVLRLKKKA